MSTLRENPHLLPSTFYAAPLETWADAIQRRSSRAGQCHLEKVEHYKALSDMEHEFLVVYASHPSGSKIVLGIDRTAQKVTYRSRSGPASQGTSTTPPSTLASSSSAQFLDAFLGAASPPSSSPSSERGSSHLAYDAVQVSHDGTPAPILDQHGPCVPLYTVTFLPASSRPTLTASTSTTSSNSETWHSPSLLHLSVLLLTIHKRFPRYTLFRYQCYFFARVTFLALVDLFGGVETKLDEGERAATWLGVHISLYSAGFTALQKVSRLLSGGATHPLVDPALIGLAEFFVAYNARRISDEKIRKHTIPNLYRVAWLLFLFERLETEEDTMWSGPPLNTLVDSYFHFGATLDSPN